MSTIPLSAALKALILVLKDSVEAFVERLLKTNEIIKNATYSQSDR